MTTPKTKPQQADDTSKWVDFIPPVIVAAFGIVIGLLAGNSLGGHLAEKRHQKDLEWEADITVVDIIPGGEWVTIAERDGKAVQAGYPTESLRVWATYKGHSGVFNLGPRPTTNAVQFRIVDAPKEAEPAAFHVFDAGPDWNLIVTNKIFHRTLP